MDMIFAFATVWGWAGVVVICIFGLEVVFSVVRLMGVVLVACGLWVLCDFVGDLVDEVLVLRFVFGQSFIGEDVVELHLYGSLVVVAVVLWILGDDSVLWSAEVGEFICRVLANGWLDLAQVEGLADLIDVEIES